MLKGSCNCGAVTFTASGDIKGVSSCHCGQCRKQSGSVWHSANVLNENLTVEDGGSLKWVELSDIAKRGFFSDCGSFLFWKAHNEGKTSFSLGAIDGASGLAMYRHIFVADKGDYYEITDGLPQRDQ